MPRRQCVPVIGLSATQAFENILNRQEEGRPSSLGPNVVPEYLALYVDEAMKHDFKALPEAEVCSCIPSFHQTTYSEGALSLLGGQCTNALTAAKGSSLT
jgi:hypothetical protein